MRYTVRKSTMQILGTLWMPGVMAATDKTLSAYDVGNIRDRVEPGITRANVEDWLTCNAGDFSNVIDFYASIEDGEAAIDIPWADEENEMLYNDCMFPAED